MKKDKAKKTISINRYKGTCLLEQDRKGLLSVVIILFVGYQTCLILTKRAKYWQARFISLVPVLYRT